MNITPTMMSLSSEELIHYIEESRDSFTPLEELLFLHLEAVLHEDIPHPQLSPYLEVSHFDYGE